MRLISQYISNNGPETERDTVLCKSPLKSRINDQDAIPNLSPSKCLLVLPVDGLISSRGQLIPSDLISMLLSGTVIIGIDRATPISRYERSGQPRILKFERISIDSASTYHILSRLR